MLCALSAVIRSTPEAVSEAEDRGLHGCNGSTVRSEQAGACGQRTREFIESGSFTLITIHRSAIYRQRDQHEQEYQRFAEELKRVSRRLRSLMRDTRSTSM
jgi:hypothetical protein